MLSRFRSDFAKVTFLSGIGGMLEFYDFILYILFSDQIEKVFFSNINIPAIKNLIVIAVFSVAYLARPLGGVLFGYLGDRLGRKKSFTATVMLMGGCIFLMSILPGYSVLGLAAPLIFVFLRIVQGLALGGELPGAFVFVYESLSKHRGVAQGVLMSLVFAGFLMGDLVSYFFHIWLGEWAWRVAFLTGSFVALLGYYLRRGLHETPAFETIKRYEKFPLKTLLQKHKLPLLSGICTVFIVSFSGVIISLYLSHYIRDILHFSEESTPILMLCVSVFEILLILFGGWLADSVPYRKILLVSSIGLMLCSIPGFYLMQYDSTMTIFLGILLVAFMPAVASGVFMWLLNEVFPAKVRYTGVATSYNMSFAIVGGFAPMIAELLIVEEHWVVLGPALVGILCGAMCLVGVLLSKRGR